MGKAEKGEKAQVQEYRKKKNTNDTYTLTYVDERFAITLIMISSIGFLDRRIFFFFLSSPIELTDV